LAGTAVEGERIAALLGVAPWLGASVVETPLKACHAPRILHLATHGGFLPDQPFDPHVREHRLSGPPGMENPMLRSFLLLAGVNTRMAGGLIPAEAEDGFLTAEDVSGMHLLGTELVVLSACDTGRGALQIGEGVMGLRRAFVLAGAQTLVMSLWHIPDIATAILMEQFYRNLLQGQGRAEALRRAQITLRQMTVRQLRKDWLSPAMILQLAAGNPNKALKLTILAAQSEDHCPFSKPYYWGGFICQGLPEPLRAVSGLGLNLEGLLA
jgi:CHAT domain-containing protein